LIELHKDFGEVGGKYSELRSNQIWIGFVSIIPK